VSRQTLTEAFSTFARIARLCNKCCMSAYVNRHAMFVSAVSLLASALAKRATMISLRLKITTAEA
jgi:hypothetical protein